MSAGTNERRTAVALGFLALLLISLPTLYGYLNQGDGRQFQGIVENPEDGASYMIWMEEARHFDGFLVPILHNPEDRAPAYFNLLWNGLGEIASISGLSSKGLYHLAHLGGVLAFFWLSWALTGKLFRSPILRYSGFILLQLGGGLGWLEILLTGVPAHYPKGAPDVWAPEMTVYGSLMTFPHFAVSLALLLAAHIATMRSQLQAGIGGWWAAPLFFALLGLVHIYDLFPAMATWALWFLVAHAKQRDSEQVEAGPLRIRPLLLAGAGALIPILFYWVLIQESSALASWNQTNQMLSPAFHQYLVALGIPGLLAFIFIARNSEHWRREPWLRLLVCWFLVTFPLLYSAPIFPFERRFMEGWWIPTALLALCALDPDHSRDARRWRGRMVESVAAISLVVFALPGTIYKVGLAMEQLAAREAPYYRDGTWEAICDFLAREAPLETSTILAGYENGLFLTECTLRFTYIGHPHLTPDYARRAFEVTQFMSASGSRAERLQLLQNGGITHIVRYADGDEAWFDDLQRRGIIEAQFESGPGIAYGVKGDVRNKAKP